MIEIRRHFLLPLLMGALTLFAKAPLSGGWMPSLLMQTHGYVQGLQRSASQFLQHQTPGLYHRLQEYGERYKILQNSYVQLGAGIATTAATCYGIHRALSRTHQVGGGRATTSRSPKQNFDEQSKADYRRFIILGQLYPPYMLQPKNNQGSEMISHDLYGCYRPQSPARLETNNAPLVITQEMIEELNADLDASFIRDGAIAPRKKSTETNVVSEEDNDACNQALAEFDAHQAALFEKENRTKKATRTVQEPLSSFINTVSPTPQAQVSQPEEDRKSAQSEARLSASNPLQVDVTGPYSRLSLPDPLSPSASLDSGETSFGGSDVKIYHDTYNNLQNFHKNTAQIACPHCKQLPRRDDRSRTCSLVRQRLIEWAKTYGQELIDARENFKKIVSEEAHAIYETFVLQKGDYQNTTIFKKYFPQYKHGLQIFQEIQKGNTTIVKTPQDLTDLDLVLHIEACKLRQVPLQEKAFILINSTNAAQAMYIKSGLMKSAKLATGKPASSHCHQFEGTDQFRLNGEHEYNLITEKHEILGGLLITKKAIPHYAEGGFAKSRTFYKPEKEPLYSKKSPYKNFKSQIKHGAGVPGAMIRRLKWLRAPAKRIVWIANGASNMLGYGDVMSEPGNDRAYWAKEHPTTKITESFSDILQQLHHNNTPDLCKKDVQTQLIKDVDTWGFTCLNPLLNILANQEYDSCQKVCAQTMRELLRALFHPKEYCFLPYKQWFEVAIDLDEIGTEQPFGL